MAFAIPLVEKLLAMDKEEFAKVKYPKVLVLEPTRELAKQVATDFKSIVSDLKISCIYGGVRYEVQGMCCV